MVKPLGVASKRMLEMQQARLRCKPPLQMLAIGQEWLAQFFHSGDNVAQSLLGILEIHQGVRHAE